MIGRNESVFSALSTYSPQPLMNPKENYLTELLAWIINYIDVFGERFSDTLIKMGKLEATINNEGEFEQNIEAVTQQYVSGGYIDMLLYDNRHKIAFICEHKINSALGENQILKYMDRTNELQQGYTYIPVLLAKRNNIEYSRQAMIRLAWREITQMAIDSLKDDNYLLTEKDQFILEQFISFMNVEGLGVTESIKDEMLKDYSHLIKEIKEKQRTTGQIQNKIVQICKGLVMDEYKWEKEMQGLSSFLRIRKDAKPEFEKRWGRVGINFSDRPWGPGLFAGIILDVEDHQLELVDSAKGPDVAVILDVESKEKNRQYDEDWYKNLKKHFERRTDNMIEDASGRKWKCSYGNELKNAWRIVVLQTPLLDVISGCSDLEQQRDHIRKCLLEGIRLLISK